ncbi:MAG: hypothetical protein ACK4TO_06255 [Candidatus Nitrosotenuis sp.]
MSDISLQIRKVIFEKYNDPDVRFTNDEIFSILQKDGVIDNSLTIDDMEQHFTALCDVGVMRNIAQNFTTQWFKLFEPLEKIKCPACNREVHLGKSEDRVCPNSECHTAI